MKLKVLVKRPGLEPSTKTIENTLEAFQELVGGYIEVIHIGSDVVMIINEEGKLEGLPENFKFANDTIVGNVVFAGVKGSDFKDCPVDKDVLKKTFHWEDETDD